MLETPLMVNLIVLCLAMIGEDGKSAERSSAERAVYQAAERKAGNDAAAHARLALWCESHGLTAERLKHLALAFSLDPANTLARGLAGLVAYQGKWEKPEAVEQEIQADPAYQALVKDYLDRRAHTPNKVDAQLKLAAWCHEKGLKEQASAHYHAVLRLDPTREVALKHLGYQKHGNHWAKPEELAAEKVESEHQRHAEAHWKPRLERIRDGLENAHKTRRDKAETAMAEVTDPRAVHLIGKMFAGGNEHARLAAVRMLGQIEGPAASTQLASIAVFDASPQVRARALEALTRRDPRDVVGRLISLVHKPFKYEVRPGNGPRTTSRILVDGEQFDIDRLYRPPTFDVRLVPYVGMYRSTIDLAAEAENGGMTVKMANGRPAVIAGLCTLMAAQRQAMIAAATQETLRRDLAVQQSLANDIRTIEAANVPIKQVNERVLPVLQKLTGADHDADPEQWKKWWTDQLGYVYQSSQPATKPTLKSAVGMSDIVLPVGVQVGSMIHTACFAVGTMVHTIDGPRPIESIQVGDRVLSQNTTTGSLAFEPVVATHVNNPSPTLRISIDGESIVATGIHRFWVPGKGWTMARDLQAGNRLRDVGNVVSIQSIEADATQPVYNLDVAENRDFFVGKNGLLVHDFSFVRPVLAPFDQLPDLAGSPPSR
jgi:hypothetical protein